MTTPFDVLALLDSLAPAYPGGIPRSAAAECLPRVGGAETPRVVFHGAADAGVAFLGSLVAGGQTSLRAGPVGALLEAAISKGLKLDPNAVGFVGVLPGASSEDVLGVVRRLRPKIGVAFGEAAALLPGVSGASGWVLIEGGMWRRVVDPAAVVRDPNLKRALWVDLQEVGAQINAL